MNVIHVWDYYWYHQLLCAAKNNIGVVIAIWAPIMLVSLFFLWYASLVLLKPHFYDNQSGILLQVYFMDTQIWYAIYATIVGGIYGAFRRLGEVCLLHIILFCHSIHYFTNWILHPFPYWSYLFCEGFYFSLLYCSF